MQFRLMTEEEIKYWYENELSEAFAENERKPLEDIFALIEENRYEVWGLFGDEGMLAYATIWKRTGTPLILLDYLGVSAKLRNGGLGAGILAELIARGEPLVVESETPVTGDSDEENDIRARRIRFYERNGFETAYEMATCGMRWQALTANTAGSSPEEVMKWHKALYGPERTDVKVPLRPDEEPDQPYWMKEQ